MKAKPGTLFVAVLRGTGEAELVNGYLYNSLGLHSAGKNFWIATHVWTGFKVSEIRATKKRAMALFEELVEMTDWSFLGLRGWENRDPELRARVRAWRAGQPETSDYSGRRSELPFTPVEDGAACLVAELVRDTDCGA